MVRIFVRNDSTVLVTAPLRISAKVIHTMIEKHTPWIQKGIEKVTQQGGCAAPAAPRMSPAEYRRARERARQLVYARLAHFNTHYGYRYGKVTIRNQKTRWGSCSRKGNLNFSYRIAELPPHLADYLVVHELCHLKEFNHSENFWRLVAQCIPDYRMRRKELRDIGYGTMPQPHYVMW